MTTEPTIRPPETCSEFRAGLRSIRDAWREAFADIVSPAALAYMDTVPTRSGTVDRFETLRANPMIRVLVAVLEHQVVGIGSITWDTAETKAFVPPADAEIRTLYVTPDRWGEGIGTALLSSMAETAPQSVDRLVLETFRENTPGRQFYESQGFEQLGTTTFSIVGEEYPTVIYGRNRLE